MGLTQSKLAVGDLISTRVVRSEAARSCVRTVAGISSWWQDSLEALGAAGYRAVLSISVAIPVVPDRSTWLNMSGPSRG